MQVIIYIEDKKRKTVSCVLAVDHDLSSINEGRPGTTNILCRPIGQTSRSTFIPFMCRQSISPHVVDLGFHLACPERVISARNCDPSGSSLKREFTKSFQNCPCAGGKRSKQSSGDRYNTASPESSFMKLIMMPYWQILLKEHTTQESSSPFPPFLTMYMATVDCSTTIWRRNRPCARTVCMITRDFSVISMTSKASLSLPLTKVCESVP